VIAGTSRLRKNNEMWKKPDRLAWPPTKKPFQKKNPHSSKKTAMTM
jgi:hypothetical protein